ncbi:unnamed protein product [Dibothriocephalus latus]|uniref:Mitoguardin n=1 Tax=Dibothriocephalus latus TaxID=60516 RepID=A0A3P6VB14_DIBLA|nr:unnamed protein product [Dibothriocephalus latus]
MNNMILVRVRKPALSTTIALALGGSVAFIAWWLFNRSSRRSKSFDTDESYDRAPKIHASQYGLTQSGFRSGQSEKSMSLRSRSSFNPQLFGSRQRQSSRDAVSTCAGSEFGRPATMMECGSIGLDTLNIIIEQLEECMHHMTEAHERLNKSERSSSCEMFIEELQSFLGTSYLLRERYKRVFIQQAPQPLPDIPSLDALSEDDTASFVSALEEIDFSELEIQLMSNFHRPLYRSALKELNEGNAAFRSVRTELMQCDSDVEYLGKLICVRQGFDLLLSCQDPVKWLTQTFSSLACGILSCLGYSSEEFDDAFKALIDFMKGSRSPEARNQLVDELYNKGVQTLNFYDIVFDRLLLDALENLGNPPSSILVLTRNNWLSTSFKKSALDSAVWTLLTAKRKLLQYPDGFFAHYYRVVETVAPALAWGFLGPDESTKGFCDIIREDLMAFVRNLFVFAADSNDCGNDGSVWERTLSGEQLFPTASEDVVTNSGGDLKENGKDNPEVHHEDDADDDDDGATITAEDFTEGSRSKTTQPDAYGGLRFTTIENLTTDLYASVGILERHLYQHIVEFASDASLDVYDALREPMAQPPLR